MDSNNIIYFIDSEPTQHVIFKNLFSKKFKIFCFDNVYDVLSSFEEQIPNLIIYEGTFSNLDNLKFIQTISKICPEAVFILSLGSTDEKNFLRAEAQINFYDYIIKPWDSKKVQHLLENAMAYYKNHTERQMLSITLESKNKELFLALDESRNLLEKYVRVEKEIKCWVHPFALNAVRGDYKFPLKRDLALMVFDIVNSGLIHGQETLGVELRTRILQTFWEIVLKHGGEVESYEGDKGYATFGLINSFDNYSNAAFAAAKEFRSAIQAINDHFNTNVETGIAIHFAKDCLINLRQVAINTEQGIVIRKWFDTSSIDVDLCHRLESLSHKLPGSNILITQQIFEKITSGTAKMINLGSYRLKGQIQDNNFYLLKSDFVDQLKLQELVEYLNENFKITKTAA